MKRLASFLIAATLLGCAVAPRHTLGEEADQWRINLKDAEIGELISQVARITGRNFVVDPRVKGEVTVISSAPLDREGVYDLFLSVLRVHGYAAVPAGEVIKIVQQTLAKQSASEFDFDPTVDGEDFVTRVIPATNVASSELVKTLRPLIPQYGHVAAVDDPNVVILSDHAENIRRLESLIEEIDVADDEEVVVVPLEDAWVENVVALLQQLAPEQIGSGATGPQAVQVVANARNNSLVLRGRPQPLRQMRELIADLDQPASSTGSTGVFRLRHSDAEMVAGILEGILTEQAEAGAETPQVRPSIQPDTTLNALVVRADPTTMTEVAAIIQQLDVRRTQVLIEAAIVEVSLTDEREVGVDVAVVDRSGDSVPLVVSPLAQALQGLIGAADGDAETTDDLDLISAAGSLSSPTLAVAKLSNGLSFAAILQAIATSSDSDLLSTPSILTLDNEEAKIVVGQNVPFRTGSFTSDASGANNPFTTIQREDVGITLKVIPHIHDGEAVRLEVEQEVSSVANASIGQSGFSDIVTNKRTIETTILADDGQTIVLGGLIQDDVTENESRVPLLSAIPIAGNLFKSNQRSRTKRNLLVFLRPTVLRSREDVADVTERQYDGVWRVQAREAEAEDPRVLPPPADIDALYEGRPEPE